MKPIVPTGLLDAHRRMNDTFLDNEKSLVVEKAIGSGAYADLLAVVDGLARLEARGLMTRDKAEALYTEVAREVGDQWAATRIATG